MDEYLIKWKADPHRKPLIIRGARQVGKSTMINHFGGNYENFISLNLEKSKDKSFFENFGDNVRDIWDVILLEKNIRLRQGETLLFIDEIQESPAAIRLLRYFYEEMPEIHVIASGSLLEFTMKKEVSFPVGRVIQKALHPFDFEEFLTALGEDRALAYFRQVPVPNLAVEKLFDLFHRYILVGGMPEAIKRYVSQGQKLNGLDEVFSSLWDSYREDVERYAATQTQRLILRHVMEVLPNVRDRFSYAGLGGTPYRSREIKEVLGILERVRLIRIIRPTTSVTPPLTPDLKRKPKLQFLDTGLINFVSGARSDLLQLSDFSDYYKGFIINHVIYQEMIARSTEVNYVPYFWVRDKAGSDAEVDVVQPYKNILVPAEIKSGPTGKLRSLHQFMLRVPHDIAIRFYRNKINIHSASANNEKTFHLLNLPYFLGGKINEYLDWVGDDRENVLS